MGPLERKGGGLAGVGLGFFLFLFFYRKEPLVWGNMAPILYRTPEFTAPKPQSKA